MRKDQARRLKFQELQRIKSKETGWWDDQNKGQLQKYVGKLVK